MKTTSSGLFWKAAKGVSLANISYSLTSEIKAYETYMRLSPQEEAASQLVISDVNSVARTEPEIKPLTLLGSRSSGLATPISDFDFTFTLPNVLAGGWILPPSEADVNQAQSLNHEDKLKAVKALRKVERHFRSSSKFSNTDSVRHARVPIIRSKHVATGLDVQIQTMAPYQAAQEYTVAYLSEFPSLRPLYIILRYCLEVRGLTTVFEGGLGSYSILMMIATAMKHSSGKFASDDLAGQLLHVLEFYGKADLYKVGFSANPPRVFEKQKERWLLAERMARMNDPQLSGIDRMQKYYPRKPYLLCLQDPANDVSDLGKNAYAIKHIQATFNKARESIQSAIEEQKERTNARAKGWIWSSLDSLVRADYRPFEESRNKVERCANPGELIDRDYSTERINKEFKRRVNQYKGVAEEDDDFPQPALEAIEENAAAIIEAGDGLNDGTRLAWHRKIRESRARTKRRQAREKTIAAERKQKIRKLQVQKKNGTNDDGFGDDQYGWEPSSPSDQKTLLEAIAAPKLALAARTPAASRRATRAKLFRKHTSGPMRTISKHFKHDEIREHIVPDDKITRATGPTTSPHRGAVDTAIPTTFSNPKPPNPGPEAPKPAPKASTSDDDKHVHGDDDEGKLVKKVHLDAFTMRRTMMPSYKRDAAPGVIDTRLESDGAFLPRSQQGR